MLPRSFSLIRSHEKRSTHDGDLLCSELMRCLSSSHDHNSYVYYDDFMTTITTTTIISRRRRLCDELRMYRDEVLPLLVVGGFFPKIDPICIF